MISIESLFEAWFAFRRGKTQRLDVQAFERHTERNIFRLHEALRKKNYRHSPYESFFIRDPKVRHIRKACVKDRVVHQAVTTVLTRIFEPTFIHDAYSSRLGKGTHRAVESLQKMTRKVSKNLTRTCWSLKCDIRKFYDSVDHGILIKLLEKSIDDENVLWLTQEIIGSFHHEGTPKKGVPIGNLTSQIFTNIYLNELDQFIKQTLKMKYYLRYADDVLLLSHDKHELQEILPKIENFLYERLRLTLHPKKIILRPLHQGIDFLGYVALPNHRVLRTSTKRRMLRKLSEKHDLCLEGALSRMSFNQSLQSYLGVLSHADAHILQETIKNIFCLRVL